MEKRKLENISINFNTNLIDRPEDCSLFSLDRMEIYEFDEIGFKIIKKIMDGCTNIKELYEYYSTIENIDLEYFNEFINNLLTANIISLQDKVK